MGFCEKIMSYINKNYSIKNTKEYQYPGEDFIMENPYYRQPAWYAIKQRRPFLDGNGYYYIYVVDPREDLTE